MIRRFDLSKILFYLVLIVSGMGTAFYFGLRSGIEKNEAYAIVTFLKRQILESTELVTAESATLTKTHPDHFLQPARGKGNGVTINKVPDSDELIFLSGFFDEDNQLRLIERNGRIVAKWPVRFYDIFESADHVKKPPATNWNVDIHGALMLADGSVVFNFEYCGLVKLDRKGNLVWKLDRETHHSVERAEKGGFWVPSRRFYPKESKSPFPPFVPPFMEDTILHVSEDGKILKEISVPRLFIQNGLETVLTASGHNFMDKIEWDHEILHLNKVEELTTNIAKDFPMFNAGDLALSIRQLNLVMVIDPDSQKVKWWRIGPWIRQHDPEFKQGGWISVFNNNCYGTAFEGSDNDKRPVDSSNHSNILELNPATDEFRVAYGEKPSRKMLSIVRGKHELKASGGILVTEFEGGRVFEVDQKGNVIWEFINGYDEDEVAEITEARVYPKTYFTYSNWKAFQKKGS